ncbi:protein DpdG [Tautonia plasticadhaerens]|uniref:Uncharacterized protein n=1 Tax=Tautonia plasticadhaerens TaxID=2527974 RepID=A0A518H984_9BACT|nr:protein DpdG [Tautonia plasticadhaerens]QDV37415.1 hypothetical protein ElP_53540 [Tautonia plasticadhaerens]
MSVLAQPYAVPSRVIGVYRFLRKARGHRESIESLCKLLAPESLSRRSDRSAGGDDEGGGRDMVREAINECLGAGLLLRGEEDTVELSPDLQLDGSASTQTKGNLPLILADLFFAPENPANHDLGCAISWYLAQDAYDPPSNWPSVEGALQQQIGGERLRITNNARYGNFEDWACFLGFAWTHSVGDKSILTPDPTAQLRLRLPALFAGNRGIRRSFPEVMTLLAKLCPAFEGGLLRAEVERYVPPRAPQELSTTTAHAWLRLRDEGEVELTRESDANHLILPDGDRSVPVSHVTWTPVAQQGAFDAV